jgi:hypothetical protein
MISNGFTELSIYFVSSPPKAKYTCPTPLATAKHHPNAFRYIPETFPRF